MSNRRKLKGSGISIQEDLTRATVSLLKKTSNHENVSSAWTADGKVIAAVKTTNGKTLKKKIFRESDLLKQ